MNLEYAVERLYQAGWDPKLQCDQEALPDGRRYPSIEAARQEFARFGLKLDIKHNLMFNCYYANWSPTETEPDEPAMRGTAIGTDPREAAVYALAQLRSSIAQKQMAMA